MQVERIDTYCHVRHAVVGAAMGARRDVLEQVGGFDEALPTQHDLDICWRPRHLGVTPTFVPEAVVHHRERPTARGTFRQEYRTLYL